MNHRNVKKRLAIDVLEERRLLAVTVADDAYTIRQDVPLYVGYESPAFESLSAGNSFDAGGNVEQIEFSPDYDTVFVRNSGSVVRVIDVTTQSVVDTHFANANFTDMSLTPDGRYLFVADYAGERTGYGTPLAPHYVHRYDLVNESWETLEAPTIAWKIEAVSENRVIVQEQDQHVDMMLNSFDVDAGTMTELDRTRADYYGDLEFDPNTNLIFHGSSGSSSKEIHVRRLVGDSLVRVGDTGVYGTADDHGGGPITLSSDGSHLYYGRLQVEANDVRNNLNVFDNPIVAASPSIAFDSAGNYFDAENGELLGQLGLELGAASVAVNSSDLWAFDDDTDRLHPYKIRMQSVGVLENDTTDVGALTAEVVSPPISGQLEFSSEGKFIYRPNEGFSGTDTFTYKASNELGESANAVVTIVVEPFVVTNSAPVAEDISVGIDRNSSYAFDEDGGYVSAGISSVGVFPTGGNVTQLEYSDQHNLLFLRNSGSRLQVVDTRINQVIDTLDATANFTDMDLTPDGNYLFVADYAGERTGYGTPLSTHYVHRYDLENQTWDSLAAPQIAWKIEAVSPSRVLLQEQDQHVDMTLNSFDPTSGSMVELSRVRADYYGDFEYDHRTGRVYHGSSGSSSSEIHVRRVQGDTLTIVGDSGTYGTAQGGGGTSTLSADGQYFYYGALQVEALDVTNNLHTFPQRIYAGSELLAIGTDEVYDASNGRRLMELGFESTVHFVSDDSLHWWSFDPETDQLHQFALSPKRFGLLSHAEDVDRDVMTAEITVPPQNGTLSELSEEGIVSYTPDADFVGEDEFKYRVFDGELYSPEYTVSITVHAPWNDQPPVVMGERYTTEVDQPLVVSPNTADVELRPVHSHTLSGAEAQIEYSRQYDRIATRTANATAVEIFDSTSGELVDSIQMSARASDFDMTPDGRYLFIADYAGERTGYGTPLAPHFVIRYDLLTGETITKEAPRIAWRIEAVSPNRVLLQEQDQHVDMTLNDFGDFASAPMIELSRVRADYYGDFEYDHRTGRVYHGSSGSSSREIHVRRILNDELVVIGGSGTYGSAQNGGGGSTLSSDGLRFYYGALQVEAYDVVNNLNTFPEIIRAANSQFAFGDSGYYRADDASLVSNYSGNASAVFVTDDGQHVWMASGGDLQYYQMDYAVSGLLENDYDPDNDRMTIAVHEQPQSGTVVVNSDGSFTYSPNAGFEGIDTFQYIVTGMEASSVATATIRVGDVPNDPPTGDVTISGVGNEYEVLTAANTLDDPNGMGDISYQWLRDGSEIEGAETDSYTLTQDDIGSIIQVRASYTDGYVYEESVTSDPVGPIENVNDPPVGVVQIAGNANRGSVLTATNNLTDRDGMGIITYQWLRDDVAIDGATSETYELSLADVDSLISVSASYEDGHGTLEAVVSSTIGPVEGGNNPPTGAVTVSGALEEWGTVTVTHSLEDLDGIGEINYQWQRDDIDIEGAVGESYTFSTDDIGAIIRVIARYTDGLGNLETVASAPYGPVENTNDLPTGEVSLSGHGVIAQTLSATNNLQDLDGLGDVAYTWFRGDTMLDDVVGDAYVLTLDDVGAFITVSATYTDGFGTIETVESASVGPIMSRLNWHNVENPADVNGDGQISPHDALIIINEFDARGYSDSVSGEVSGLNPTNGFPDVNDDSFVAPLDALLVINQLGEPTAASPGTVQIPRGNVVDLILADWHDDENEERDELRLDFS